MKKSGKKKTLTIDDKINAYVTKGVLISYFFAVIALVVLELKRAGATAERML